MLDQVVKIQCTYSELITFSYNFIFLKYSYIEIFWSGDELRNNFIKKDLLGYHMHSQDSDPTAIEI